MLGQAQADWSKGGSGWVQGCIGFGVSVLSCSHWGVEHLPLFRSEDPFFKVFLPRAWSRAKGEHLDGSRVKIQDAPTLHFGLRGCQLLGQWKETGFAVSLAAACVHSESLPQNTCVFLEGDTLLAQRYLGWILMLPSPWYHHCSHFVAEQTKSSKMTM